MIFIKELYTKTDYDNLINHLLSLGTEEKKLFDKKLIPTNLVIIGIKTSTLRDIIKILSKGKYVTLLPYFKCRYYEEVLIKLNLVSISKDLPLLIREVGKHADNWASVDTVDTKFISRSLDQFYEILKDSVHSQTDYIIRFVIVSFMNHYLNSKYIEEICFILQEIKNTNYYVEMALAWFLSILFIKNKNVALKVYEDNKFTRFVINKSISKIHDSFRVTPEDKEYVKKYRK